MRCVNNFFAHFREANVHTMRLYAPCFNKINCGVTRFFYNQRFFSTQPQCCLTFPWIELQMLLRCCLIHITIIILRHILHLVYFCLCLGLGLFMSHLCDLFFISSIIFIVINNITSFKQTYLLFCTSFRIF